MEMNYALILYFCAAVFAMGFKLLETFYVGDHFFREDHPELSASREASMLTLAVTAGVVAMLMVYVLSASLIVIAGIPAGFVVWLGVLRETGEDHSVSSDANVA